MQHNTPAIYRDLRFWLALASFALLAWMTFSGYPLA